MLVAHLVVPVCRVVCLPTRDRCLWNTSVSQYGHRELFRGYLVLPTGAFFRLIARGALCRPEYYADLDCVIRIQRYRRAFRGGIILRGGLNSPNWASAVRG